MRGNLDDSKCTGLCEEGKFQRDASTGNVDDSKCSGECPVGRFSGVRGLASESQCENCGENTFNNQPGQAVCLTCGDGKTGEFKVSYFMYRYILRESCSQFDSLPLTALSA